MSETTPATGSCLCGAVHFTAKQAATNVGACHCSMCRKWAGGPWFSVDCGADVSFTGEENITVLNSSQWAERGSCKKCGSNLFYRLKGNQQHMMSVGLFDDDSRFTFDHQVFIDEKPAYYQFANQTEDMTGPEVFAKYAPPSD